ncbi:MAG TPA: nicotinate-nucleotide adenylyltransferase [Stellaceae bacterium]|nr:nicotinate-nucleotide adenylyltransferase [Stellaceae bacterium]
MYGLRHRRIGLLGGSFNPAHGGHLHISLMALKRLDLDEVWWLVSPQNPLKPVTGMAEFADRLAGAAALAKGHPRIKISAIEAALHTSYTADTIAALARRFPRTRFVWLMGGDNLAQLPRWKRWIELVERVPIAVFDRPRTSLRALAGKAPQRFARARVPADAARNLAEMEPPAWAFFYTKLDPRSATEIRAGRVSRPKQPKESATVSELPARRRRRKAQPAADAVTALPVRRRRKAQPAKPPAPDLLARIVKSLEDGKAEDIVTIDLGGKTEIADYMVIASGRSARQVVALTEHLLDELPKKWRSAVEGKSQGDWVLIDAGDVIVHLFRPETRLYYNLEKMWGAAWPQTAADAEAARN